MGPAAAMRAVLATTVVATAWAGGTRRVGSDWPHHGVGSAPRIPIGYPLPAPRAVRSPQGRTVVVKGDAAARSNNDAPDLRPWWRRQAIADPNAAWVEELLKKNCANGSFWLPLTDHGPTKFAQGAALGARSGLLDLKKVSANHIIIFLLESAETATREPAPETFCGNSTVPCYGELRAPMGSYADGLKLRAAVWKSTSELGYPENYCGDLCEPPRHRAAAVTGTTSRRWRGISTPSSRHRIASMAWAARNCISTQVATSCTCY